MKNWKFENWKIENLKIEKSKIWKLKNQNFENWKIEKSYINVAKVSPWCEICASQRKIWNVKEDEISTQGNIIGGIMQFRFPPYLLQHYAQKDRQNAQKVQNLAEVQKVGMFLNWDTELVLVLNDHLLWGDVTYWMYQESLRRISED